MNQTRVDMMRGIAAIGDTFKLENLNPSQRMLLDRAVEGVEHYRQFEALTMGLLSGPTEDKPAAELGQRSTVQVRGRQFIGAGEHYLDQDAIDAFERRGVTAPYRVMSADAAAEMIERLDRHHADDFGGEHFFGDAHRNAYKRTGQWTLSQSAMHQHARVPELFDFYTSDAMVRPVASILGPDVMLWRSQAFQKIPGDPQTFWHQSTRFREGSKASKLIPTEQGLGPLLQLTTWVALTDVTVETSAMQFLPGTFADVRVEWLTDYAAQSPIRFLCSLPKEEVQRALMVAMFSPTIFPKAQVVLEQALDRWPDILDDVKVEPIEMRAGECIAFLSGNLHSSTAFSQPTGRRLAIGGRYTVPSVQVCPGWTEDYMATPSGPRSVPRRWATCVLAHGEDRYGHNPMVTERPQPIRSPAARSTASDATHGVAACAN